MKQMSFYSTILLAVKDYVMTISNCASHRLYGHEKELLDDIIFIQRIHIYIFKRFVLGDNFQINHRVLILDGHGSYVTLKALQYTTYCIIHYRHIVIVYVACITTCRCCMNNNTLVGFFSWFSLQTNMAKTISW